MSQILFAPSDVLKAIAHYVKKTRIAMNIKAQELADRSGIGVATINRIEKTGQCTTENFAKILAVFDKLDKFVELLKPEPIISISDLERHDKNATRQRVRKSWGGSTLTTNPTKPPKLTIKRAAPRFS
jgi:transcriptional regulator with XRE-family HTH domain